MANLNNQPSIRDLPVAAPEENPWAQWVDKLEGSSGNLDPGNPKHTQVIEHVSDAIARGYIDQARAQKLITRNRAAAPIFAGALAQQATLKQQQGTVNDIYSQSFQPGRPGNTQYDFPRDEQVSTDVQRRDSRNDYAGAIQRLNALGPAGVEQANKLAEQEKKVKGDTGRFNSLDSAYAAIGITDPRTATKAQHKQALALFQPPVVTTRVGEGGAEEQVVRARGDAVNTATPTGKNYYKKDIEGYAAALDKSRIPAMLPPLRAIDRGLAQYDKTGEFPGIGNLNNMRVAQFVKTPQGRFISSAVQSVFNEELRQASGTAVTEWEESRKRIADALGTANSAADYIRVYRELIKPRIQNAARNLRAGYGEAADIHDKRSGLGLKEFAGQPASAAPVANGWSIQRVK